ncbi:MAG: hypothetical protein JNM07_07435 [Phycisphaerae bacterium]|nr:hypothetical protein [Phycisphaerae bacterium]
MAEELYFFTRHFNLDIDDIPPNQDRSDRCCTCITALPLWRAKGTGPALTPRAFATAFFRAVDSAGGCYYGLADADERDALNGFGYYMASRAGGRPFTWRQDIERMDWLLSGEQRRTRIRHDAWVQYLPAPLLARLDHAGDFVERFVDRRTPDEDGTQFGERFPTGGAVLGVCEDPLTEMFGIGAYAQADRPDLRSAVWLRHEFRKAGML